MENQVGQDLGDNVGKEADFNPLMDSPAPIPMDDFDFSQFMNFDDLPEATNEFFDEAFENTAAEIQSALVDAQDNAQATAQVNVQVDPQVTSLLDMTSIVDIIGTSTDTAPVLQATPEATAPVPQGSISTELLQSACLYTGDSAAGSEVPIQANGQEEVTITPPYHAPEQVQNLSAQENCSVPTSVELHEPVSASSGSLPSAVGVTTTSQSAVNVPRSNGSAAAPAQSSMGPSPGIDHQENIFDSVIASLALPMPEDVPGEPTWSLADVSIDFEDVSKKVNQDLEALNASYCTGENLTADILNITFGENIDDTSAALGGNKTSFDALQVTPRNSTATGDVTDSTDDGLGTSGEYPPTWFAEYLRDLKGRKSGRPAVPATDLNNTQQAADKLTQALDLQTSNPPVVSGQVPDLANSVLNSPFSYELNETNSSTQSNFTIASSCNDPNALEIDWVELGMLPIQPHEMAMLEATPAPAPVPLAFPGQGPNPTHINAPVQGSAPAASSNPSVRGFQPYNAPRPAPTPRATNNISHLGHPSTSAKAGAAKRKRSADDNNDDDAPVAKHMRLNSEAGPRAMVPSARNVFAQNSGKESLDGSMVHPPRPAMQSHAKRPSYAAQHAAYRERQYPGKPTGITHQRTGTLSHMQTQNMAQFPMQNQVAPQVARQTRAAPRAAMHGQAVAQAPMQTQPARSAHVRAHTTVPTHMRTQTRPVNNLNMAYGYTAQQQQPAMMMQQQPQYANNNFNRSNIMDPSPMMSNMQQHLPDIVGVGAGMDTSMQQPFPNTIDMGMNTNTSMHQQFPNTMGMGMDMSANIHQQLSNTMCVDVNTTMGLNMDMDLVTDIDMDSNSLVDTSTHLGGLPANSLTSIYAHSQSRWMHRTLADPAPPPTRIARTTGFDYPVPRLTGVILMTKNHAGRINKARAAAGI